MHKITLRCFFYLVEAENENPMRVPAMAISQAAIASAIHLTLSLWMLTYGLRIYFFLTSSSAAASEEMHEQRQRVIKRVLVVAMGFSLCNLLRSICTILVVSDNLGEFAVYDHISLMAWFLISQWVPYIIPV
jgi:uncharacterized membrane protein